MSPRKKILSVVVATLIALSVLFSVTTTTANAKAAQPAKYTLHRTVYKTYVVQGKYPSIAQCKYWAKTHTYAERWRLYAIRATYSMIKKVAAHKKGWKYVWNVDWVIQIATRESTGIPSRSNGCHWGLLEIDSSNRSNPYRLFNAYWNLGIASQMFSRPGANGRAHPWSSDHVSAQPLAKRDFSKPKPKPKSRPKPQSTPTPTSTATSTPSPTPTPQPSTSASLHQQLLVA
jgi:hypothetical protein